MRGILVVLTMFAAFIIEGSFAMVIPGAGIFLPISAFAFCFWGWRMRLETRLWFGLAVGFIMDTLYLVPFGAHMLTFLTLALVGEMLRFFFSNMESNITHSISVVLFMALFLGLFPLYRFIL